MTYSPVGGARIEGNQLAALRAVLIGLAEEHGMPGRLDRVPEFEGKAARVLYDELRMSPHEAAQDEVWSYLTCCWLMDIAVWRFGADADERRYIGNVNRNTFRRLWWRAEILGPDIDLTRLGEDELVNIMERPTIAADRRLARAVAFEFLRRIDEGRVAERMQLMREAMKRLLRLTPTVAFSALDDAEIRTVVHETFEAAVEGMNGRSVSSLAALSHQEAPEPSLEVVVVERPVLPAKRDGTQEQREEHDFDGVGQVAIDIARRTGRVTNMTLREVVAITSDEAREVFADLIDRGILARRGVKRGTYYVLAEATGPEAPSLAEPPVPLPSPTRNDDSALRRLLRRRQ